MTLNQFKNATISMLFDRYSYLTSAKNQKTAKLQSVLTPGLTEKLIFLCTTFAKRVKMKINHVGISSRTLIICK